MNNQLIVSNSDTVEAGLSWAEIEKSSHALAEKKAALDASLKIASNRNNSKFRFQNNDFKISTPCPN